MDFTTTLTPGTGCLQRSGKRFVCLAFFVFFFALIPGYLGATTYYVDATGGNDAFAGTSTASPWKTLKQVNGSSFSPGDSVLFKRGESWHESLVIPSSGTAAQPITFGAYGSGDLPLFDGTYANFPQPLQWAQVQGNIYKTTQPSWPNNPGLLIYKGAAKPPITTLQFTAVPAILKKGAVLLQTDTHYTNLWVTSISGNAVSGITFFKIYENEKVYARQLNASGLEEHLGSLGLPKSITSLTGLTESGHWYWHEVEKSIYLYSATDPNTIEVKIAQLTTGINSAHQDYVIIQDIAVQGYKDTGVLLTGTQNALVQNMHVADIGASSPYKTGILINNSKNNTIKNNTVESALRVGIGIFAVNAQPFSHGNTVTGNTVLYSGSAGISLSSNGQLIANTVENNTIVGNTVLYSNTLSYDAAGIYALFIGAGNKIQSNTVKYGGSRELRSSGVMIEGGNDPSIKPVTVDRNTIENNSLAGISVSGKSHVITNNILRNNGVPSWDNAQLVFFNSFSANAASCTAQNNVMEGTSKQILVSVLNGMGPGSLPHTINNNTYCSTNSTPFCWSGSTCANPIDFNTWKNESGHDSASSFTSGSCSPEPPQPGGGKSVSSMYILLLK